MVSLQNDEQARQLISRSVMSFGIYELWGYGETYDKLHEDVRAKSADKFEKYKDVSFKFDFKNFRGRPSNKGKVRIIESFSYLPFEGKIDLKIQMRYLRLWKSINTTIEPKVKLQFTFGLQDNFN